MEPPPLETRHTRVTTGTYIATLGSPPENTKLQHLAASHPFIQQLDVIFSSSDALSHAFEALEAKYWTCTCTLSTFIQYAKHYVHQNEMTSDILALGLATHDSEDVWCLDSRGILTLAVSKTTYERLGLVGEKLPWRGTDDTFVIHISLRCETPFAGAATRKWHRLGSKELQALEAWDSRKEPWRVLYHHGSTDSNLPELGGAVIREIKPVRRDTASVHIPSPVYLRCTGDSTQEDWTDDMSTLFEWVGLACLGSQRLQANDKVDPYIAVYTRPSPSRVGDITHVRWTGLLAPALVQSITTTAIAHVHSSGFVSLTMHGVPYAPVGYLSSGPSLGAHLRAPRPESEDTTCLILSGGDEGLQGEGAVTAWVMAESIGQWDMRWG